MYLSIELVNKTKKNILDLLEKMGAELDDETVMAMIEYVLVEKTDSWNWGRRDMAEELHQIGEAARQAYKERKGN